MVSREISIPKMIEFFLIYLIPELIDVNDIN